MKLILTPRATRDVGDIADYIRAESPLAAQRVRAAILSTLETLLLFPEIGRPQTIGGVRKAVTRRYRYVIYYTVDDARTELIILSVQHAARDRPYSDR